MAFCRKLNRELFEKESLDVQNEILELEDLFTFKKSYKLDLRIGDPVGKVDLGAGKELFLPIEPLVDEFYEFMLSRYDVIIEPIYRELIGDFDENTFGHKEEEVRSAAIQLFKEHYGKYYRTNDFEIKETEKNGDYKGTFYKAQNRFKFLSHYQRGLKNSLATREYILEYLYGNIDFFTNELIEENERVNDFVMFEISMRLLKTLNSRYQFEQDDSFSKTANLRRLYDSQYSLLFHDFEFFQFVHHRILSFKDNRQAYIHSFFHALLEKECLKVIKPKKFLEYVNSEFGLKLIRIKNPSRAENNSHHDRKVAFVKEIEKYEGGF